MWKGYCVADGKDMLSSRAMGLCRHWEQSGSHGVIFRGLHGAEGCLPLGNSEETNHRS